METVDNEVLQALSARKSVRVYTDEPVTEAERDAILQAVFWPICATTSRSLPRHRWCWCF